jgi:hypothetical protein
MVGFAECKVAIVSHMVRIEGAKGFERLGAEATHPRFSHGLRGHRAGPAAVAAPVIPPATATLTASDAHHFEFAETKRR